MVVCMEGGYNLTNLKECSYSVLCGLAGISESDHEQAVHKVAANKAKGTKMTKNS